MRAWKINNTEEEKITKRQTKIYEYWDKRLAAELSQRSLIGEISKN
jgi:hypothetical protein